MKQSVSSPDPSELESLARYLLNNQDAILARWQDHIKEESGEQPPERVLLSRRTFYENMPLFLQQIYRRLRSKEMDMEQSAAEHEAGKWEQKLDLGEVVNSWKLLHQVLVEQINRSQEAITMSPDTLIEAHRRLPQSILLKTRQSVDKCYRYCQREIEGKLHELESAARRKSTQKGQRGVNLHQVSHDLKGSMTALRMNLNLLERANLDEQARGLVERLSGAADSLTQLLENLLDLSRLQAGREELQVEEFDAAGLLGSLCESLQPLAEAKGLELRCSGVASLRVYGDPLKVRRVAQNLLLNALKYTPDGFVEVVWSATQGERWQLTIRDTGPGLDPASEALFTGASTEDARPSPKETTTSTSGDQQSEGVGLLIVRELCELLGGEVEVESEAGTGTVFRIVFPAGYPAG